MNLLVPKLSPLQLAAYLVSLVVCFIFRGEVSPDISYAIEPVTLAILGATYAAAKGLPKFIKGLQSRRALKKYAASPEGKAQAKIGKEAREDLDRGAFGKSQAEIRKQTGETTRSFDAGTKAATADIMRLGAKTPLGGGAAKGFIDQLAAKRVQAGIGGRAQAEALSDVKATKQIAADKFDIGTAASQKMAMLQGKAAATTSMVEGGADTAMAGVGIGADLYSSGAFTGGDAARAGAAGSRMTNVPVGSDPFAGVA